jgi:ATP-dependent DNA ligase
MRSQLRYDGRRVCVRSRTGRDCTDEFPELAAIADQLAGRSVILDGELVCLDAEGKPDFAALREPAGRPAELGGRRAPPHGGCADLTARCLPTRERGSVSC